SVVLNVAVLSLRAKRFLDFAVDFLQQDISGFVGLNLDFFTNQASST
ncbi:hypothetical protein D910_11007, partial [Dendroctonus ponderosae]